MDGQQKHRYIYLIEGTSEVLYDEGGRLEARLGVELVLSMAVMEGLQQGVVVCLSLEGDNHVLLADRKQPVRLAADEVNELYRRREGRHQSNCMCAA